MTDETREQYVARRQHERAVAARLRRIGQYARSYDCPRYEAEERLIEDLWGVMGGYDA